MTPLYTGSMRKRKFDCMQEQTEKQDALPSSETRPKTNHKVPDKYNINSESEYQTYAGNTSKERRRKLDALRRWAKRNPDNLTDFLKKKLSPENTRLEKCTRVQASKGIIIKKTENKYNINNEQEFQTYAGDNPDQRKKT